MSNLDRRTFLAMGGATAPGFNMLRADSGSSMIDDTLRSGIARRKVPAVAGMGEYGQGLDWAGKLVEALSGTTLEEYFQQKILRPLGMEDTSYILPVAKFERLVSNCHRTKSGALEQDARKQPTEAKTFNGGGGLFSTTADYARFMQMILNHGAGPGNVRILQAKTEESMKENQIGALTAGKMKS